MKILLAFPILATLTLGLVQASPGKSELGLSLGWGAVSGNGIEYAYRLDPSQQVSAGVGFSLTGARYSAGYRYLFRPEAGAGPFVGMALSGATGLSPVSVRVNRDSAEYAMRSGLSAGPRAGFRFGTGRIRWYANSGYHFVLLGGGADRLSESASPAVRKFADAVAVGGLEISGAMLFGF